MKGLPEYLHSQRVWPILSPVPTEAPTVCEFERFTTWEASLLFRNSQIAGASPAEPRVYPSKNEEFWSRSRHAENFTTGALKEVPLGCIVLIFRG